MSNPSPPKPWEKPGSGLPVGAVAHGKWWLIELNDGRRESFADVLHSDTRKANTVTANGSRSIIYIGVKLLRNTA
jgi:hypothetical protein